MAKNLLCGGSGHVGAVLAPILQDQGHQVITLAFDESPAIAVLKGRMPVLLNAGLTVVDVRDVAAFTAKAALNAPAGASYVLTGPWAHFRDLSDHLRPYTGHKTVPLQIPLPVLQAIGPLASRIQTRLAAILRLPGRLFTGCRITNMSVVKKPKPILAFCPVRSPTPFAIPGNGCGRGAFLNLRGN